MNSKKVIIIGAGIAGLSAGCYLQMNGYDTEIFEAHSEAGGLCTAWKRKDYVIEGCVHGLLGSSASHPLYKLWDELVDMKTIEFSDAEIKHVYDFDDGRRFVEYADLDKLEQSLKKLSPEDGDIIEDFINDTRRFQTVELPYEKPKEFFDLPGKLKMIKALPLLLVIKKWIKVSAEDFSKRFKNPFLKEVVKHFSSPVLFEMFILSEMALKRCGYPIGGSLQFVRRIEEKYRSLGGRINFKSRVAKIIVKNDRALGVDLENGSRYTSDIVISAADGRTTLYNMLEGRYLTRKLEEEYKKAQLSPSKIQVSLGVNSFISSITNTVKVILSSPLKISDGNKYSTFDILAYNSSKGIVPDNKTLLIIQLDTTNSGYWAELKMNDIGRYKEEKQKVVQDIIEILDGRFGGIKENIDMVDVATPATYIRYTGNWNGSIQGWANDNIFKPNSFGKELSGLKDFFMAGQWVEPGGGVPAVFKSGRDIAQIICRKDKVKFNTDRHLIEYSDIKG